jgi:hypothetical protein
MYTPTNANGVFDANGNLAAVNTGDDRTEGVAGSSGVNSFNGDAGSNSYGFAQGDNRNDYGSYSYSDPFNGMNYGSNDVSVGGNDGRFGVDNVVDSETQWWSFMHRMWNHVQDSHRYYSENKLSRNFLYPEKAGHNVVSNLASATSLAGRFVTDPVAQTAFEGIRGHNLNDIPAAAGQDVNKQPWKVLDDNLVVDTGVTWGNDQCTDFPANALISNGVYDNSWELGAPLGDATQKDVRWFQGSTANNAVSQDADIARMSCMKCEVQYALKWDSAKRSFQQYRQGSTTIAATTETAWAQCNDASNGATGLCEYSSGVCFVEERRTFGYITLVRKGCKQAKACYMNKYQNFLVQAGRQCWPGDHTNVGMAVARRPHDIKADEWIYNLIRGADSTNFAHTAASSASAESFKDVTFATDFDITFTDVSPNGVLNDSGRTKGFYINEDDIVSTASVNPFTQHQEGMAYRNGMVFTSWCYQCCNMGNNCNENWKPETERDWAQNWIVQDPLSGAPTSNVP